MGNTTMGSDGMKKTRLRITRLNVKGFTLIASLLMLLLMSGMAIGLLMMVNTEGKVGGSDLQNNVAYHAAEGGIEKMYSDLSAVFNNAQAPTAAQICAASAAANQPTMPGVTWTQYSIMPGSAQTSTCPTTLSTTWGQITAGPNQGLYAQVIPVNMLATASLTGGQEVTMIRQTQVALIPVFQYGMFCENDCSIFPGGGMTFNGPIHSNGDFYPYVGSGANLTFQAKVSAFGNIIRTVLPNLNSSSARTGNVYVPTANSATACSNSSPSAAPSTAAGNTCTSLATVGTTNPWGDGSLQGAGGNPAQSSYSSVWNNYSNTTLNDMMINGNYGSKTTKGTGAKKLSMPFVNGSNFPYEVIRRPKGTESASTLLGQSREYNMAQIRVLLSDDPAEFKNGTGATDPDNVRLANVAQNSTVAGQWGVTIPSGNYSSAFGSPTSGTYNLYFASASNGVPIPNATASTCSGEPCLTADDWPSPPVTWTNAMATAAGIAWINPPVPSTAPIYWNNGPSPTVYLCPPNVTFTASPSPALPSNCPAGAYPYYSPPNPTLPLVSGALTPYNSAFDDSWSTLDGWLRVEYLNNSGNWVAVTNEWLQLGFARGVTAPTASVAGQPAGGTPNPINPKAILLLQEPADRSTNATLMAEPAATGAISTGTPPSCTAWTSAAHTICTTWAAGNPPLLVSDAGAGGEWAFGITPSAPAAATTPQSLTEYNWYPINFYDSREGEPRDIDWSGTTLGVTDNSCTANGVMNAVEIDVGNLEQWLLGNTGTSGTLVNSSTQNGYILYFSDRRGMLPSKNAVSSNAANTKTGDSGLEDTVNSGSTAGTTDGALETTMAGHPNSPEDDNQNGLLDNWGAYNLGMGFYGTVSSSTQNLNTKITSTAVPNPYGTVAANGGDRIALCGRTARKNWVSGARHVLKLVDASLGNVPLSNTPIVYNGVTYNGGFTVASENPVYLQGDYNSNGTDTAWSATPVDQAGMAASAVLADSVTLLSNAWDDRISMVGVPGNTSPTHLGNRTAVTTSYRLAIAAGKNMTFASPSWATAGKDDVGTDGGIHNFLHLLENWGGTTTNYKGSMASLYYSTYATGFYKCCNAVYSNGTRNFSFDADFKNPAGLPPGTPMFRDVESLGYRQVYATRLTGQ